MENQMLELLKTRRSVRAYRPEQVKPGELDAVLEAGTYAPTGMGKQSPVIVPPRACLFSSITAWR